MQIFRYWESHQGTAFIDGVAKTLTCYGGADQSPAAARQQAIARYQQICAKIAGNRAAFAEYTVSIREEWVESLSPEAVITRNRYGALILNTATLPILDIDTPMPLGWWDVLRGKENTDNQQRIVDMVSQVSKQNKYRNLGFRIYATAKGVRVFVLGMALSPQAVNAQQLLRDFHCDHLYRTLCHKQDCYRARLTPKPQRIGLPHPKRDFPGTPASEIRFQDWLVQYNHQRQNYNTCHWLADIGQLPTLPPVVQQHDQHTGAFADLPLA